MPRNMAPANISSPRDLVPYKVSDASPVEEGAPAGYIERYIHSEIYKKFPGVNSVIHSHAHDVVPYSVSGVPLKPCLHMAGFLGPSTPVYEISKHYQADDVRDLLIRNIDLGKSLASCFINSQADQTSAGNPDPTHAVVLMRGHGYTIVAPSIEACIFRAIYTKENAIIQTTSLGLSMAYRDPSHAGAGRDIEYLRDDEIQGTTDLSKHSWRRAWGLWVREVEALELYVNQS